jgi:ACS family tartrate transporter-like MFS transporter
MVDIHKMARGPQSHFSPTVSKYPIAMWYSFTMQENLNISQTDEGQAPYRWVVLGVLLLTQILIQTSLYGPAAMAMPVQRGLGVGNAGFGIAMAATNFSTTAFVFLSSVFVDRIGMNRTFACGLGALALGGMTTAGIEGLHSFVIARVVQGLGIAIIYPVASALIMQWFSAGEKAYANAAFLAFAFIGTAVAFQTTSFLTASGVPWRITLFLPGATTALILLIWIALPRPPMIPQSGRAQMHLPKGSSLSAALRMPVVWILAIALFACRWVHEAFLFFLPLLLQSSKGMSTRAAAQLASVVPWSGVAGILLFGVLAKVPRLQKRLLILSSILVISGAYPLLFGTGWQTIAGLIIIGFGLSGLLPVHITYVMSLPRITPSIVAAFLVITNITTHLAGFISPIAVGRMSQTTVGLRYSLALFSAMELVAIISFAFLPPTINAEAA